jgi:hypothetical protein
MGPSRPADPPDPIVIADAHLDRRHPGPDDTLAAMERVDCGVGPVTFGPRRKSIHEKS